MTHRTTSTEPKSSEKEPVMEMSESIYVNSDFCTDKKKTDSNVSLDLHEDIYQNEDVLEDHETKSQKGTKTTESGINGSRWYLLAMVCLVLLCVLLLGAIGGIWIYFTSLSTQNEKLQTSYNNLSLNNETLQTSYNKLILNSEELKARHNELITERERLQRRLSDLEREINKPGWIYFSSSIYYISTEERSWSESRQNCRDNGADLVIINTKEEQEFVYRWSRGVRVWIGLTDSAKEGTWKWVDDTAPTTTFWGKSEPDSRGDEDCAIKRSSSDLLNDWADFPCTDQFVWMCEKKILH